MFIFLIIVQLLDGPISVDTNSQTFLTFALYTSLKVFKKLLFITPNVSTTLRWPSSVANGTTIAISAGTYKHINEKPCKT